MSTTSVARLQDKALKAVTTEIVSVSPDIARQMLVKNTKNRPLKKAKIKAFARDMACGRWQFDGMPIRFGTSGALLDGQNRLQAVIASEVAVPFLVIKGLPDATQEVMDTGTKRTTADQLNLRGEPHANLLAAIGRRGAMWDQGHRTNAGGGYIPSESEIRDFIDQNPQTKAAAEIAQRASRSVPLPPSVIGLAYFVCSRVDVLDAKAFFIDQLTEQIGLQYGDPAKALHKKFKDTERRTGRVAETDLLCYVLKAWNLYRTGQRATALRGPREGWNSTNVPTPV